MDTTESEGDRDAQFYEKVPKRFLYSRQQAAAALAMSKARLDELIRDGKMTAVRDGRRVKFSPADLQGYVDSLPRLGGAPGEPEHYPAGLTRRSWLYHQRYPDGNPHRRAKRPTEVVPPPIVQSLPSNFRMVYPEPSEVIAAMPDLTQPQLELLNRLRRDGEAVVNGKRNTVEALAKRGLVTYEAEYALNETHLYYFYRFTVHPK